MNISFFFVSLAFIFKFPLLFNFSTSFLSSFMSHSSCFIISTPPAFRHTQHSLLTPSSLPRQRYSAHRHGNTQSPCYHNPFPSHNEYLTRFTLGGLLYGGWVCGIFCTKHTHSSKYLVKLLWSFLVFNLVLIQIAATKESWRKHCNRQAFCAIFAKFWSWKAACVNYFLRSLEVASTWFGV